MQDRRLDGDGVLVAESSVGHRKQTPPTSRMSTGGTNIIVTYATATASVPISPRYSAPLAN
jgi:hypothetical protein